MVHIILLAGLLGCSAFFSGSETAFFSLSREARRRLWAAPGRSSRLVRSLLDDPQELLLTVLFGNMLVNTAYFSVSAMMALRAQERWQTAVIGLSTLAVIVLCGEVLPKNFSVLRAEQVARATALPLYGFQVFILPVRKVLGGLVRLLSYRSSDAQVESRYVTAEELKLLVDLSADKGVIDRAEHDMIEEVVELSSVRVKEIMAPRVDVPCFDLSKGMTEFRDLVRQSHAGDVVVYEGTTDNVVGIARTREALLAGSDDLRSLLREPRFVPEVALVERVLRLFRAEKEHIAVAVDEYGGMAASQGS